MRGLPPPPPGVLRLDVAGTIDAAQWTTGWWMFVSSEETLTIGDYADMLRLLTFSATAFIAAVASTNTRSSTCRLSSWGSLAFELVHTAPDNHGAWGDSLPGNEAAALSWLTGERGRKGVATQYLPGLPGDFTSDSVTTNPTGTNALETNANAFSVQVNAHTAPIGHQLTLGVLHRVRANAVLHPGEFVPFLAVKAAPTLSHRDGRLSSPRVARF